MSIKSFILSILVLLAIGGGFISLLSYIEKSGDDDRAKRAAYEAPLRAAALHPGDKVLFQGKVYLIGLITGSEYGRPNVPVPDTFDKKQSFSLTLIREDGTQFVVSPSIVQKVQ